jgi:ribosomal protein S18 acetylase RimI-like enzyme
VAIRIEPLGREHRPLLGGFRNQHPSLTEYLKRFALRHAEKDLLSRTHVAIDRVGDDDRIAGYFSMSMASVERGSVARVPALDRLPRFPIPAILLARLAVDVCAQGQGLGRYLFEEALGKSIELGQRGPVGFRLLVADAIDDAALRFYERLGLVSVGTEFPCRAVLDLLPLVAPGSTRP